MGWVWDSFLVFNFVVMPGVLYRSIRKLVLL